MLASDTYEGKKEEGNGGEKEGKVRKNDKVEDHRDGIWDLLCS